MNNATNNPAAALYNSSDDICRKYCDTYIKAVQNYNGITRDVTPEHFLVQAEILRLRVCEAELELYKAAWMFDLSNVSMPAFIQYLNRVA